MLRQCYPGCWLGRSYIKIVFRSSTAVLSSSSFWGAWERAKNVSVASSQAIHVSNAVFYPSINDETVSQPVEAWNKGSAIDSLGPSDAAISWAVIFLKCWPTPKASYSCVLCSIRTAATANTTTSVSTVLNTIILRPCWTASDVCNIILKSAFSWLHGPRSENLNGYIGRLGRRWWWLVFQWVWWRPAFPDRQTARFCFHQKIS